MDWNNNRNALLIAAILGLIAIMSFAENSAMVIFILLGLLFLVRQFDNNRTGARDRTFTYDYDDEEDEYAPFREEVPPPAEERAQNSNPIFRHALRAVSRAGLDPDDVQVLPVDIGLLIFREDEPPQVYRTWELPDDADYVQPYVELRLPRQANGRIKFELLDSTGNSVFIHEDYFSLERGRNFINPASRLPIHDQYDMDGKWALRISADGVLLADHRFSFTEANSATVRRHLGEDGEMTTELRAVMAETRLQKMSLDELLEYQQEEEENSRRQS